MEPLSIAVDDLGSGLWAGRVKQALESRVPLRNALFGLSRAVISVEELPVRYLDARGDAALQRLRQLAYSPAAWFRCPLVQLVLVSCGEYEDYKRDLRIRLRAMADTETSAPGQPELLFAYVRPTTVEAGAKGPARVFDAMRRDLNRRRERCVRLDPTSVTATEAGHAALLGLDEYERQLKEALRAAFEARAAAYTEEVRRLMAGRLDPAWSFPALFLAKDGLAAMLEAAGLLEDALREYSELEACYLEMQSGQQARQPFGGKTPGADEAALLWAPWAATRASAAQPEQPPEFAMRQALFASQARLLLKLHRHAEVAERGLKFVQSFGSLLAVQQRAGSVPPQLREAWSFASCISLAAATSWQQAARAEEKRRTDHLGRGGARKLRQIADPAGLDPAAPASSALPSPALPSPAGGAQLTVHVTVGASSEAEAVGSPTGEAAGQQPLLDWQLGVLPSRPAAAAAAAGAEGGAGGRGGDVREGPPSAGPGSASLYLLLGKLYCAARAELLRLGAAAGLEVPKTAVPVGAAEQHPPSPSPAPAPKAPVSVASDVAVQPPAGAAEPQAAAEEASEGLQTEPSSSDLAQVDLGGQQQGQQAAAAAQPAAQSAADLAAAAAALKLESTSDGHIDPAQAAASQLARLSVRPNTAQGGGGDESPSSSPHSISTQPSTLASDAGHAVAAAAPPLPTPRTELNDLCSVERQVVSALGERSSRALSATTSAAPPDAALPEAAGLPPWLVHWRLRVALSSQQLFTELFVELSEAAAKCYSQCGHARSAALLRADVADALAKGGLLRRAADLYERQCRTFLREGWHALAAQTLPKLAACQLAVGGAGLAHTAAALLSLPAPFRGGPAERQAACQLLLQAATLQGCLAGRRPLPASSPPAAAGAPDACVDLTPAISAAVARGTASRFFGRTGTGGGPLLFPPPGEEDGAHAAAVGDALAVQIEVDSSLPVPLRLRDVVLTLGVLQEMTVIHSPPAASSPVASLAEARAGMLRGSPAGQAALAGPFSLGALSLPMEVAESSALEERYESQWQLVEELQCPLVAVSASGGGGDSGAAAAASPSLQPLCGEVVLPPGRSVLTFIAAPVKRGLYKALHIRASLQQLPLHVSVHPPAPLWATQGPAAGGKGAAQLSRRASRAGTGAASPLALVGSGGGGGDVAGGASSAEAVVMLVEQAQPRVQLSLLAAGGSLVAGQEQWLGLALAPQRDTLHGARLELSWPLAHPAAGLPLPRKATGVAHVHRSVQSVSDLRLAPISSAAAAVPPSHPYVRPEHRTAVLLGADAGGTAGSAPQLLPAEGPTGPAAWLLDGSLQQQLELPAVQEGRPVSLWWRVTAGEVAVPPEPVPIAPPAPRLPARQHDPRRLGAPADALATPAAVLDLPASLEYTSGCQRSHSRVLAAAVCQPFSVQSVARELPGGRVALQCSLTSNMAVPARLARLALEPQPGFSLASSLLDGLGLLPAGLPPFGSLAAAFVLAPSAPGSAADAHSLLPAKLQPSALVVEYSIDSLQQCGLGVSPLAAAARPSGSGPLSAGGQLLPAGLEQTPAAEVLDLLNSSSSGPAAPAAEAAAGAGGSGSVSPTATAGGGEEGAAGRQQCSFRHLLSLEMPSSDEDTSGALVLVRLLGPFVAVVGQPTTLCWRLERASPAATTAGGGDPQQQEAAQQPQPAARIGFEVLSESDAWRPVGRRYGGVTLAGHPGAVATLEATWVPLAAGSLPVPVLSLQDVGYQEVFDVGLSLSGTNAITVVEASG